MGKRFPGQKDVIPAIAQIVALAFLLFALLISSMARSTCQKRSVYGLDEKRKFLRCKVRCKAVSLRFTVFRPGAARFLSLPKRRQCMIRKIVAWIKKMDRRCFDFASLPAAWQRRFPSRKIRLIGQQEALQLYDLVGPRLVWARVGFEYKIIWIGNMDAQVIPYGADPSTVKKVSFQDFLTWYGLRIEELCYGC
jgi:hypothetical protein